MPTGLIRRGARYSIRRRIPLDVLHHYPPPMQEITRALGTADPKLARKLLPLKWAELEREFDAFRLSDAAKPAPTKASPPSTVRTSKPATKGRDRYSTMSREEWEYLEEAAAFASEKDAREENEREEREEHERRILALVKGPAEGLTPEQLAIRDLMLDSAEYRQIAEQQAANRKAELREARAALKAQSVATASSSSVPDPQGKAASPVLDVIVKKWAAERQVKPKGFATHHYLVGEFIGLMGDLPVAKITKADVLAFKDKLLGDGDSLANIKVKLSRLRTLLNYAVANDYIPTNPANDVRVVVTDADRRRRKPFDLAGLKTLFGSSIYREDDRPTQGRGEASYWLPLLGLYTGARLEELGQLRPSDVREEEYLDAEDQPQSAWFIHVTEDEEDGLSIKNAGSERTIPVHAALANLGFIKLVQTAQRSGQDRLFPLLRADKFGRLTAKWGEWFGAYKRGLGITDRRLVFHSLRHTFKQFARGSLIEEGVQRQIMGHSSKDVADSYGDGYPMHRIVDGMKAYRIPGFELPASPPEYRAA